MTKKILERIDKGDYVILDYAPTQSPFPLWIYNNKIKEFNYILQVWRNVGVWDKTSLDLSNIRVTENKGLRTIKN